MLKPRSTFGEVGGSALSTDSSPNTAGPAENRKLANGRTGGLGTALSMWCIALGGTTISIRIWMLTQIGIWVELSGGAVVCLEGELTVLAVNLPASAEFFTQITANTDVERIEFGFTSDVDATG